MCGVCGVCGVCSVCGVCVCVCLCVCVCVSVCVCVCINDLKLSEEVLQFRLFTVTQHLLCRLSHRYLKDCCNLNRSDSKFMTSGYFQCRDNFEIADENRDRLKGTVCIEANIQTKRQKDIGG